MSKKSFLLWDAVEKALAKRIWETAIQEVRSKVEGAPINSKEKYANSILINLKERLKFLRDKELSK